MRAHPAQPLPLSLFAPPYDRLEPLRWDDRRFAQPSSPGTGLVWQLGFGSWSGVFKVVRRRPPGMALIVILPATVDLDSEPQLLRVVEACRPHSSRRLFQNPASAAERITRRATKEINRFRDPTANGKAALERTATLTPPSLPLLHSSPESVRLCVNCTPLLRQYRLEVPQLATSEPGREQSRRENGSGLLACCCGVCRSREQGTGSKEEGQKATDSVSSLFHKQGGNTE